MLSNMTVIVPMFGHGSLVSFLNSSEKLRAQCLQPFAAAWVSVVRKDKGRHASVGLGGNVAQSLKDRLTISDI